MYVIPFWEKDAAAAAELADLSTDLVSFLPVTGECLEDLEAGVCRTGPD